MRLLVIIAGLAGLFLISLKSENPKQKTNNFFKASVCFEQRDFDFSWDFEHTETNLYVSFKQYSKNDNKRNNESIGRLTNFACKHLLPEMRIHNVSGPTQNLILSSGKTLSLLQVFLL